MCERCVPGQPNQRIQRNHDLVSALARRDSDAYYNALLLRNENYPQIVARKLAIGCMNAIELHNNFPLPDSATDDERRIRHIENEDSDFKRSLAERICKTLGTTVEKMIEDIEASMRDNSTVNRSTTDESGDASVIVSIAA